MEEEKKGFVVSNFVIVGAITLVSGIFLFKNNFELEKTEDESGNTQYHIHFNFHFY